MSENILTKNAETKKNEWVINVARCHQVTMVKKALIIVLLPSIKIFK